MFKNIFKIFFILLLYKCIPVYGGEITLSGKLESNIVNATKSLYLEGKQGNKNYSNQASFKTIHSYIKSNNKTVKYRALFDYEQISKKIDHNKFIGVYLRHKNDKYRNSEYQNYSIITLGRGRVIANFATTELYIGKRLMTNKDIYIIRPSIEIEKEYKNLGIKNNISYIAGKRYDLIKNKLELYYKISKRINIKYILNIEKSKYYSINNKEKSNTLALSLKF